MFATFNNTNIYNDKNSQMAQQSRNHIVNQNYNSSINIPHTQSGHGFNQMLLQQNDLGNPKTHLNILAKNESFVSEITGQEIPRNEVHNNMVPFMRGNSKQNMDPHANESILERYTGVSHVKRANKQEVESFFDVKPDMGSHVNGSPAYTQNDFENRFYASKYRQGEKPFQDIKVGPGINRGFDTSGHGGFQDYASQEFAKAQANRLINNRLPNNPKLTYTTPVKPGFLPGGTRGLQAAVNKNRPERWYRNTPDRYFKTGGAIKAAKLREKVFAKATRRQNHKSYFGGLGQSALSKPKKDSAVRKSRRINHLGDTKRNVYRSDAWSPEEGVGVGDYGAYSIENKENERDVTGVRTHRLNLTSNVKKLIAPLLDVMRRTRKENFIGNVRPEGNMNAQMPSKMTVHDPNDVARTTKKELTEDNEHMGHMNSGVIKQTVHDPNDVARTTKKELTEDNEHNGHMSSGVIKLTVHDPNDIARTTRKELNIHNEHDGFLKGPTKNIVWDPEDVARTTIKEQTIDNHAPYVNLRPQQPNKLRVYDPEDIARTTLKEMTEENNHNGFVQYPDDVHPGGYISTNVTMRNTNKQFISDYYYAGNPNGNVGKGDGKGYLTNRYKAKATQKQFISDREHMGGAGFHTSAQMSYSDKYNMRTNPNKERISVSRFQAEQGPKVTAGRDLVNLEHRRVESSQINRREPAENAVYQAPPQQNQCGLTTVRQKLPEQIQRDRIAPDILNAFRNNPYTKPLSTAV
jgi:hypothetical protein